MTTRGFSGKGRPSATAARLPPGQFLTDDFPVLSAGPTPRVALDTWRFTLKAGPKPVKQWTWEEFNRLPAWEGVSIDDLLADAGLEPPTPWLLAHSSDDYTTNVPLKDLVDGRGMVAIAYDGQAIPSDHGGPARLLVPHLYFWKSAKWVNGLQFTQKDEAGFWELRGYHMYGDPWQEQRYSGD